jgi:hypothetical protein
VRRSYLRDEIAIDSVRSGAGDSAAGGLKLAACFLNYLDFPIL